MTIIWMLIDLLYEFPIFALVFGGLIAGICAVIIYKVFMKLLSMFS